jgi:hypothetical protein
MHRYYFHLHECDGVLEDVEGLECISLQAAKDLAATSARGIMAGDLLSGRLSLGDHIAIVDGSSTEVERVYFRDVVIITGM